MTRQATIQSADTNKLLMRRYAAVQKARDADIFGILVGTLGVASYLPLIAHLRQVLARAHKKAYTISVGKLNPAKLANFPEIECFVLVACPENSLVDAKDFLRPIVTPFELQLALQPSPTWTGDYVLDFDEVLAHGPPNPPSDKDEEGDPDRPMFSLITGRYRHAKRYGGELLQHPSSVPFFFD
jgi:diphthamide biosynthesis protein 2